jgi:hypothetical protein
MKRQPHPWLEPLPEAWTRLGCALLNERGIDEENYRKKTVKERLMDAMAVPNIEALIEHARTHEAGGALKRIGLHPGTPNRWLKHETQPHAREFFGLLLVGLRKEMSEVRLPRNREVIWEAVSRTLAVIRVKECERDRRRPSHKEFSCVWWLMRHPSANEMVPDRSGPDQSRIEEMLADIACKTQKTVPGESVRAEEFVRQAIMEWAIPYTLFRIGLLNDWEFLDEAALGTVLRPDGQHP